MAASHSKLGRRLPSFTFSLSLGLAAHAQAQAPGGRRPRLDHCLGHRNAGPSARRFRGWQPAGHVTALTRLFPDNQASDQNFRMIVRPDAPGQRVRVRFSNLMGSKLVTFGALGIATHRDGKALTEGTVSGSLGMLRDNVNRSGCDGR